MDFFYYALKFPLGTNSHGNQTRRGKKKGDFKILNIYLFIENIEYVLKILDKYFFGLLPAWCLVLDLRPEGNIADIT